MDWIEIVRSRGLRPEEPPVVYGYDAGTELHFLERTDLQTHLSPARAIGLAAVVRRIRMYAEEWT